MKYSIILPCYNVEKYIAKSIESVLNQSYTDFELLVVIDGSPDNSKSIALRYAQNDSRIKIFEKENGGLSDARNYGLERASGEYVYFMDSDDWIEPTLLEDNLKIIEDENLDLIVFGYIQDDEDSKGSLINSTTYSPDNRVYIKTEKNLEVNLHLLGLLGYAWNKIYRKSFLNKHNLRFEKGTSLVEDILFNSQVYCKIGTLRTVNKAYYHYLNRPVETLIKKFHKNSFELKKRKTEHISVVLDSWSVVTNKNDLLSMSLIGGLRYCVHNLFSYRNQFSFWEKVDYIKVMLNDSLTTSLVPYYSVKGLKNNIYKYLILHKQSLIIALLAKLFKS